MHELGQIHSGGGVNDRQGVMVPSFLMSDAENPKGLVISPFNVFYYNILAVASIFRFHGSVTSPNGHLGGGYFMTSPPPNFHYVHI